jgi:hypothetical protein
MFDSLRYRFAQRGLQRLAKAAARKRRVHTLDTATSIQIVFDATVEAVRKEVLDWVLELERAGKKVRLLGYFDSSKAPESIPSFDFFFRKELNWNYSPKSQKVEGLLKEVPDLLVGINPKGVVAVDWVVLMSKASMKVGMVSGHPNDIDLQIDLPEGSSVKKFVSELRHYLDKIITR